ncbi:MAG: carbohydrate kinase family protein [Jatrophihabitans sp.]
MTEPAAAPDQRAGRRLTDAELQSLRQAAQASRVLVIGTLNHDEILVADHNPGDEGAVLVRQSITAPGGHAGNCASALAALGVQVALLAAVGADPTGDLLVADLREHRVDVSGVARIADAPTGRVVIPVLGEHHFMLLLPGANDRLSAEHVRQALATDHDALVVFDPALAALAEVFADAGGSPATGNIFWTPGGIYAHQAAEHRHLARCRSVLVNRNEWQAIEPALPPEPTEVIQTLGPAGASARCRGELVQAAGEVVSMLDPTGAGDAFAAGYVLAALAGLPLARRLAVGNICGALAVTAIGARGRLATMQDLAGWP